MTAVLSVGRRIETEKKETDLWNRANGEVELQRAREKNEIAIPLDKFFHLYNLTLDPTPCRFASRVRHCDICTRNKTELKEKGLNNSFGIHPSYFGTVTPFHSAVTAYVLTCAKRSRGWVGEAEKKENPSRFLK